MKSARRLLALTAISLLLPLTLGAAQFCTNTPSSTYRLVLGSVNLNSLSGSPTIWRYAGGFYAYNFDDVDLAWVPSAPAHRPGEGFLMHASTSLNNYSYCFPEPTQSPVLPLALVPGINLVCCQSNVPATYENIVGLSPVPGTRLYRLRPGATNPVPLTSPDYSVYTYLSTGWVPSTPVADAGEAVIIYAAPFIENAAIANGSMEFDVLSPVANANYQITIERTDSLIAPAWQTVTSFTAAFGATHVSDPDAANGVAERYYRARF